jgi:hypothetical protein
MSKRLEEAVDAAWDAFWIEMARHYPECKTGDLSPLTTSNFDHACRKAAEEWVELNSPKENEDGKA